jgi:hypothetical protein
VGVVKDVLIIIHERRFFAPACGNQLLARQVLIHLMLWALNSRPWKVWQVVLAQTHTEVSNKEMEI